MFRLLPEMSQAHKRRASLSNEGPSARRRRNRSAENSVQEDESSDFPSPMASSGSDAASTSQLSTMSKERNHHSDPLMTSKSGTFLVEETTDEVYSQTSGKPRCCVPRS